MEAKIPGFQKSTKPYICIVCSAGHQKGGQILRTKFIRNPMSDLVSEEVRQIFRDVLERSGDCYTCLKFEEAGIKLGPDDIPEVFRGIRTHGDIHALPVYKRIEIYLDKVDWNERSQIGNALKVVNHYLAIFFAIGPNPKWVKDEILDRLEKNGLGFKNQRLVRFSGKS